MNILHLSALDTVFLIITACAISLFFILAAAVSAAALVLIMKIKKVVAKAENAIDSVEEATATIRNIGAQASGPMAIFKVIRSILNMVDRHK